MDGWTGPLPDFCDLAAAAGGDELGDGSAERGAATRRSRHWERNSSVCLFACVARFFVPGAAHSKCSSERVRRFRGRSEIGATAGTSGPAPASVVVIGAVVVRGAYAAR
jgi:hypothetical protein